MSRLLDRGRSSRCSSGGAKASLLPAELGEWADSRADKLLHLLRARASSSCRQALSAAGWPPESSAAGEQSHAPPWPGWGAAAPAVVDHLAALTALQAAAREGGRREAEASRYSEELQLGPARLNEVVWAVEALSEPLAAKAWSHFCEGRATDRVDRPEWPLTYALGLARDLLPHAVSVLRPALILGCSSLRDGPLSSREPWVPPPPAQAWTQGVGEAVAAHLLRSHILPHLESAPPELWLHAVDEAIAFDRALLTLCNIDSADALEGGVCTCVVAERSNWAGRWFRAELEHWLRLIDAEFDAPDAWSEVQDEDYMRRAGGLPQPAEAAGLLGILASPPACAERVVEIIRAAAGRCRMLHPTQRKAFLSAVPCALVMDVLGRLRRRWDGALSFELFSESSRRVTAGRCIAAARVLRRALLEVAEVRGYCPRRQKSL